MRGRARRADNPACGHCGGTETTGNGSDRGRRKWRCHTCGRSFTATTGTPVWRLKTPVVEVARALLIVLRRGSLRAAEEQTGHKYETIGRWLRRAAGHAAVRIPHPPSVSPWVGGTTQSLTPALSRGAGRC